MLDQIILSCDLLLRKEQLGCIEFEVDQRVLFNSGSCLNLSHYFEIIKSEQVKHSASYKSPRVYEVEEPVALSPMCTLPQREVAIDRGSQLQQTGTELNYRLKVVVEPHVPDLRPQGLIGKWTLLTVVERRVEMNHELDAVVDGLDEQVFEHVAAVEAFLVPDDLSKDENAEGVEEDAGEADDWYDDDICCLNKGLTCCERVWNRSRVG